MIVFPNAKINLGLHVISKRLDGFHNLESIFSPIPFYDILEIIQTKEETSLHQSGLLSGIDPKSNLCMKAYHALKKDFSQINNVAMWLHKTIPSGAGLGGGSSDAAFTLLLLNKLFKLSLSAETLKEYAAAIGSDCPFFIENKVLLAKGKGDKFTPISLDLSAYKWIIIKPKFSISTIQAYAHIIPQKPKQALEDLIKIPISHWKHEIQNDFEKNIFLQFSELPFLKDSLYKAGAVYAAMSGSGSAMYGIFEKFPNDFPEEKSYKISYQNESLRAYEANN